MQTQADADRMAALCQRPRDVHVTGNCKFDMPGLTLSPEQQEALRTRYRLGTRRPTVVVGSTHPGEEEIVLEAFRQTRQSVPNLLLILSPRPPERFNEIFTLCQRHPANWRVSRATDPQTDAPDIFLLDTMGELARTYGLGDLGVVAGSFGNIGGHNLLEAAVHSIPVLVGPNMHAQKEIDRLFSGAESGCVRCRPETLGSIWTNLLQDPQKRQQIGAQALATATRNQGSARASIEVIRRYLQDAPL
jgi:3-deoxy-D-manno-octulosonic-acid transferase